MNNKYGEQAKKELNDIIDVMVVARKSYESQDYRNLLQSLDKTYSIFKWNHNREFIVDKNVNGKLKYIYKISKEDKEFLGSFEFLLENEVENLTLNKNKTLNIDTTQDHKEWVLAYKYMLELLNKVSNDNKESTV